MLKVFSRRWPSMPKLRHINVAIKRTMKCHTRSEVSAATHERMWRIPLYSATVQKKPRVIIALSGGVDSAVSAFLLKRQGVELHGVFMQNWSEEEEGYCSGRDDLDNVHRVCKHLDIPYTVVSFEREYWNYVFEPALNDFTRGYTPNPDVICNREIKFNHFLDYALQRFNADYIATGHYARVRESPMSSGKMELLRGVDEVKDQTYFLAQITQRALRHTLFPVGAMRKSEVRALAKSIGLPNAKRKGSVGVCFVGKRQFSEFLGQYIPAKAGRFLSVDGTDLGEHRGAVFYTHGQRAGISGGFEKHYVVGKDMVNNIVYVCKGALHPALFCDYLASNEFTWIAGHPPPSLLRHGFLKCQYKVRYRLNFGVCTVHLLSQDELCDLPKTKFSMEICNSFSRATATVTMATPSLMSSSPLPESKTSSAVLVKFERPQRCVTPGQFVVLYDDEVCLGSGPITVVGPNYFEMNKTLPLEVTE
jgi:tRNA-specific 2-thiouridylase